MNAELEQKTINALSDIIESVVKVKDFAVDQAPDVIQQLLKYEFWSSLSQQVAVMFLCLLSLIIGSLLLKYKWIYESRHSGGLDYTGSYVIGGVLLGVGIAGIIIPICASTTLVWFKIWIAPKVFLLEYAANLVK